MVSFSRRTGFFVGVLGALFLTLAVMTGSARGVDGGVVSDGEGREFVPGEIIVKLEDDATTRDLERINDRIDAETKEEIPEGSDGSEGDLAVVDLPRNLPVEEAVEIYAGSPDVEYAEPDYILRPSRTPNDPEFPKLYGLHNTGQSGGTPDADIDAPEAWDTTTGDADTVVAVIDEGVDINHPDLRENIWTNPDEIPGNGRDDDGNGFVDDVNGWDFFNNDASVYDSEDGDAHGTHVAGTIAARGGNSIGVVGVNWRAGIMPLKFLGPDGGSTSGAVKAIDYAVREGAKISNNSWGGGGFSQSLRDAIGRADTAGHLFVAAAGNGGADGVGDDNDTTPSYPASYDLPNVISVAATNNRDTLASFSNFGARSVDIAAPGVSIASTLPNDRYGNMSGTSMAAPHVAGVAALVKSREPGLDDVKLKERILSSADGKPGLSGKVATDGRLNAANALSAGETTPSVTEPPATVAEPPAVAAPRDTVRPTVVRFAPRHGVVIRNRAPLIVATVRDDRTNLAKRHIRLFIDGRARGFAYDPRTDRLSARSARLSFGWHTVRIVAKDAAGNTTNRSWRFQVVR